MHQSLVPLQKLGWRIVENQPLTVPEFITARYGELPAEWADRLASIECCEDPRDQTWFVTPLDMHGTSGSAYAWNEAEKQSLEAAQDDTEWASEISEYWDAHLPIMFSVANGYETWAICLRGANTGKIVHSTEPEYEEGTVVADSLDQFINMVAQQGAAVDAASRRH